MGTKKTQNDNCVLQKSLETTIFYRLKQLGPDNNTYLAQIITPKMAKLGPDNNFTTYIYIYIYIYICRRVRLQGLIFGTTDFQAFFGKGFFVILGGWEGFAAFMFQKGAFFPNMYVRILPGVSRNLASEATGSAEPVG